MRTSKILLLLLISMSVSILAQTPSKTPSQQQQEASLKRQDEEQQRRMEAQREQRNKAAEDLAVVSRGNQNQRIDGKTLAEQNRLKLEAIAELNAQFAISDEYRNKYGDFLKQKNTGIVRMFPDTKCDVGLTVTVEELERCSNIPQVKGGGSRYSIKFNWIPSYMSLNGILNLFKESDIYYNGNTLLLGNQSTQSIVSEIGDVNLDEITIKSAPNKFLTNFKPSRSKTEFQQQTKILEKGINANGYLYSVFAPVKLNSTYVFRSIAFSPVQTSSRFFFWNTDLFVAFKIVGWEDDGSIIFIWKKLKEKSAPYLENK